MRNKRFVRHFYTYYRAEEIEKQINDYADEGNLKIITIAYIPNGIFVLFEENEDEN